MGISDINKTLKTLCPDAFLEVELSRFKGLAIGIDASLWLFKAKSSALKDYYKMTPNPLDPVDGDMIVENIVKQFYGFVAKICNEGVIPVWIFDGTTHPAKIACDARKAKKDTRKIDIESERKRIESLSILERANEMPKYIKKVLSCICIRGKEIEALKEESRALGLPSLIAPHDAEIFASALSKKQLLVGVWTSDTDTYACGSLITFRGFSAGSYKEGMKVEIFVPAIVRDHLGITQEQFRDMCIMHECDFNKRIPGFGPSGILKKLEEHDWCLDTIMLHEPDKEWDSLNIAECRQIFDGPEVDSYTIDDMKIDRSKWESKLASKLFEIEYPGSPRLVELV